MSAVFRGHTLNNKQCACLTMILNEQLNGKHRGMKKFHAAFEAKCAEKGCPIPEGIGPLGPDPEPKRKR